VCSEDATGTDRLDRLAEREATIGPLADAFEPEEPGMALVHVEHLRVQVECAQGAHTADPEDDLLAKSVLLVAPVQTIRDRDDIGRIAGHVRVEQIERDSADVDTPDLDQRNDAGEFDLDDDVGLDDAEGVRVDRFVPLLLPPVGVEALTKVSLGVEQAHTDQRHAEVGRGLQVVAGENS
jgi:hypothetical protein